MSRRGCSARKPRKKGRKKRSKAELLAKFLRICEVDRFLDDCFWENQHVNTYSLAVSLPLLAVPETVKRLPKKRKVDMTVGGAGFCWKKIFPNWKHEMKMPVADLVERLKRSNDYGNRYAAPEATTGPKTGISVGNGTGYKRVGFSFVKVKVSKMVIKVEMQSDGDLHIADCGFWVEQPCYCQNFPPGYFGDFCCMPPGYGDLTETIDALEALDGTTLIGSKYCPEMPERLKPIAIQLTDAFDIAFDPVMFAKTKDLVQEAAKWYWKHATGHLGIPKRIRHDDPPPVPPDPILPPGLPNVTPEGGLEEFPHVESPLETLLQQLECLLFKGVEHIKEAYDKIIEKLNDIGIYPDNYVKFFILNFRNFSKTFASKTKDFARLVFEHYGVGFLIDAGHSLFDFLRAFVTDVFNMTYNVLDYAVLAVKIVHLLLQDFTEYHGADHVYRRALLRGKLNLSAPAQSTIERHADVNLHKFKTQLPNRLVALNQQTALLSSTNAAENITVGTARDMAATIVHNINQLPDMILPEATPPETLEEFQSAFSTYNVTRGVDSTPHPRLNCIRRGFRDVANDYLGRRNRPVRAVGASNTEMPTINRLTHNCWPNDSGRTDYRQKSHHSPLNAAHRAMTCPNRFQDCDHINPTPVAESPDVWSFFSAHDIPPDEFIMEMARGGSDTAVVALHLPFPLLDRRVRSYTDVTIGLHYEVEGGKLLVYHLESGSAGYAHDFETVYAWMHNMPVFTDANVTIEVLAQVGTAVLLNLQIGRGKQEVIPNLWSCQREPFYILPELTDDMLRLGERPHFAVAGRRFEQLVAFVATLPPTDRSVPEVMAKLRGMLAEIRVGIHTVEARWSVTMPQMYSLVQHSIIAHDLHMLSTARKTADFNAYFSRVSWRTGNFLQRIIQYRLDLVMFRAGGEADPLSRSRFRYFTTSRFDHKNVYNPYQRAGNYRVVNLDERHSDKLNPHFEMRTWKKRHREVKSLYRHLKAVPGKLIKLANNVRDEFRLPDFSQVDFQFGEDITTFVQANRNERADARPPEPNIEAKAPDDAQPTPAPAAKRKAKTDNKPGKPGKPKAPISWAGLSDDDEAIINWMNASETAKPSAKPGPKSSPPVETEDVETPAPVKSKGKGKVTAAEQRFQTPPLSDTSSVIVAEELSDAEPVEPPETEPDLEEQYHSWFKDSISNSRLLACPSHLISPQSSRQIDFSKPLIPMVFQHTADHQFQKMLGNRSQFFWPAKPIHVPVPTHGGMHLITAFAENVKNTIKPIALPSLTKYSPAKPLNQARIVKFFQNAPTEGEDTKALTEKFQRFAEASVSVGKGSLFVNLLMIEGPPMCAKSTLARLYVKTRLSKTLVYVPSGALQKAWREDPHFAQHAQVLTRQSVPAKIPFELGIIDEVFNFSPLELYLHLRMMRSRGCQTILLLGDRSQREQSGIEESHPYLSYRLVLHTSLGMPRDAHALYKRINSMDESYDTTGETEFSIFFTEEKPNMKFDLTFQNHKHSGDIGLTIGQVQGSRAAYANYVLDGPLKQASWLTSRPNSYTVAFTRHTKALVVTCSANIAHNLMEQLRVYHVVGRKPEMEHLLHPRVADNLIAPVRSAKLRAAIAPLRAMLSQDLALDGHHVILEKDPIKPATVIARGSDQRTELVNFALEGSNFALPAPDEMDIQTAQPRRNLTFTPPGPPVQRDDVRNDLPGSHLLAAIHVNSSGYDSFKNLVDRQIATTKSTRFGNQDTIEGARIYERFVQCYYRENATILDIDKQANWLAALELNALNAIAHGEPLGETKQSLTIAAEFKTQTKAKAIPGFAATLPYGQSILATPKAVNAKFAGVQPLLYGNLPRLLRDNVIMDYGMSDDELSYKLRNLGVAADMNGPRNIQADVSKQDSSHTAGLLYAFFLIARDCGLDQETMEFYLAYCRRFSFVSRGTDHTKSTASMNLPSGDMFTLIRNNVMELCVIACRYKHANSMTIVEKGDDVHGVINDLTPHPLARLKSIAAVKLTVDYGVVGYHAGRFHNGTRYLVDPVRAFLKHFTRLQDNNVTNEVLYSSYVSRATDYDDEEFEFLIRACQVHYPFYSGSQVMLMVQTMLALRDRETFEKYSVIKLAKHRIVVDTKGNCASNCVRALRPGRHPQYYRKFANLRMDSLSAMLAIEGIPHMVVPQHAFEAPPNVILLTATHAKVELSLTEPIGTFKIPKLPSNNTPSNTTVNGKCQESSTQTRPRLLTLSSSPSTTAALETTRLLSSAGSAATPNSPLPVRSSQRSSSSLSPSVSSNTEPTCLKTRKLWTILTGWCLARSKQRKTVTTSLAASPILSTSPPPTLAPLPRQLGAKVAKRSRPACSSNSPLLKFQQSTPPTSSQGTTLQQMMDPMSLTSASVSPEPSSAQAEASAISMPAKRKYQLTAIIGDHMHKLATYECFGDFGPAVDRFFSASSQAAYMRNMHPELIPPPQAGVPPSDHTISTVFEWHFATDVVFRSEYLQALRKNEKLCLVFPCSTTFGKRDPVPTPIIENTPSKSLTVDLRAISKQKKVVSINVFKNQVFSAAFDDFCSANALDVNSARSGGVTIDPSLTISANGLSKGDLILFSYLA